MFTTYAINLEAEFLPFINVLKKRHFGYINVRTRPRSEVLGRTFEKKTFPKEVEGQSLQK